MRASKLDPKTRAWLERKARQAGGIAVALRALVRQEMALETLHRVEMREERPLRGRLIAAGVPWREVGRRIREMRRERGLPDPRGRRPEQGRRLKSSFPGQAERFRALPHLLRRGLFPQR